MTKKEAKRSKHDWPQVCKSIGTITIVSILSVVLFGLLYWALKLNTFQFELSVAFGIIWIIATELLLSRFINIVQDDLPQRVAHFALFVALASGMLGAGDYAQRSISPYHDCDSIVKENLGDAEFIHSSLLTEVDTSMLGYYIFPTVQRHYQRGTADVTFEAYVATPVKQSKGVYMVYRVSGKEHDYSFASDEKLQAYYHEFCVDLRDTLQHHRYDTNCTTFQRISSNNEHYDYILKAVENAYIVCNDSAYSIDNHPAIIMPIYGKPLIDDARVKKGYVICFTAGLGVLALVLLFARTRKVKRKGKTDAGFDMTQETIKYVRNPKNWPCVFIFVLPIIYYIVALFMGYTESSSVLDYGAISGYHLFVKNEWWRLVTSMLMHANIPHLLINLMVLFFILAFWGALFPLYQGWRGALVFFGAGIVSSFCCALYSDGVTVGASGAIMGMLAYPFGCLMFNSKKRNRTNKSTLLLLAIIIGPIILLSFTRGISLAGHVSGLLCGFLFGVIDNRLHIKE